MGNAKATESSGVFELTITLLETEPKIWRRVLVKGNTNLEDLHRIIQIAMGWDNYHMHQFKIGGEYYGVPDKDFDYEVKNECKTMIADLYAREKRKFGYEYDFGDSWYHEIKIKQCRAPAKGMKYPTCLEGEKTAPPEDCGGIPGFYGMLETLSNPKDPEYARIKEWMGNYSPDRFDKDAINKRLARA
jgi:hypothetical protein